MTSFSFQRGGPIRLAALAIVTGSILTGISCDDTPEAEQSNLGRVSQAALPFTPSEHISFTLEGCRNDGTITLPNGSGDFICPDADYTTGNLGKGWNELDLVPHRLTTSAGNQAGVTTLYDVYVAADNQTGGRTGYDVLSVPVVNAAKSDASCAVSADVQSTQGSAGSPFGGGTDVVIYRQLTLQQDPGTTCVLDYYERLALGSHLYPGSSLQSYMFDQVGLSGAKKTISIPVNQILPQSLSKDMAASQGTNHIWDITKSATPATVSFGNTCDPAQSAPQPVIVTVSWVKHPADASGPITVTTHVYATNPAARTITTNVTDVIYSGATALNTSPATAVDVPANTTLLVLTHTAVVPSGTTNLNDIATATYTDKVTGVPVPGTTTATASATVQPTGPELNASAQIHDVESITGAGLTYSADAFTGASGSFDGGYVAGTPTSGQVSWTSSTQTGDSSVSFNKTLRVTPATITSGTLSDVAVLTGSSGFTTSAAAGITISADARVSLMIHKTIPDVLQGAETVTFTFQVKNSGNATVATPTLTFAAGETSKTVTVGNLPPGTYTVSEDPLAGWQAQVVQTAAIDLPTCAGAVTFNNTLVPTHAQVEKISVPAGFEAGWTFTLNGPVTATVTTGGPGPVQFPVALPEGNYTITEAPQAGWSSNGGVGCAFTVHLPADAGQTYSCTFTNTYQPSVGLTKTGDTLSKIGDPVTYAFTLTNTSASGGPAGAPSLTCTLSDPLLGFSRTVTLPPGGVDTSTQPFTIPPGASDPFVNTATATCTYPGFAPVVASSSASWSIDLVHPSFTVSKDCKAGTQPIAQAGPAVFTISFQNTGDADLHVVPSEGAAFDVAAGASHSYDYSAPGPFSSTVSNTVTGTVTLAPQYGLPNSYTFTASGACTVEGKARVLKTVSGGVPPAGQAFTFELRQGASTLANGTILETQTTDAGGNLSFGTSLVPGEHYQLCEWVFPGWNTTLGPNLFVPNSMTTPTLPNPTVNNLTVCTDFTVTSGQTLTFTVDNTPPPGGRALTIGFWKNWASCSSSSGKGQKPILDQTLSRWPSRRGSSSPPRRGPILSSGRCTTWSFMAARPRRTWRRTAPRPSTS
jgi:hypothetical protein